MKLVRSYRYRLEPTGAQRQAFGNVAGACRFVYNLALEQREQWWRQFRRNTGCPISYYSQSAELTALRADAPWLQEVPRDALDGALQELQRAYDAFFAGRARYPSFRKRSDGCGFALRGRDCPVERLNTKWSRVRLPRIGWVKFRTTRGLPEVRRIVSVREDCGRWFVSFKCEVAADAPAPDGAVGIDRGITNTLALSTGELLQMPASILAHQRRRQKAQRALARRKKGSVRRGKQKARVGALWARERRARADWLHRQSAAITRQFGYVAVEALMVRNMTASAAGTLAKPGTRVSQKRGLNRAILHQGWGEFERQLAYKLEASGGTLVRVPAAYSSQTCQSCGVVDAKSRESQATFRCVHYGHEDHADTNAALEILRRSTSAQLVEGQNYRPAEARTTRMAA